MKKQTMKRMAILTIVSTILMGSLVAQQGRPPQPPPIPDDSQIAQMVDELTQKLSLSDKQAIKILDLYTDHFSELKIIMADEKTQHEQQKTEMDKFRLDFESQIKDVLNDDQKVEFEKFLENHKPRHKPNDRGRK